MRRLIPLLLSACVFLEEPPEGVLPDPCLSCADDEACDGEECTKSCSDGRAPCVDPDRVCVFGDCEIACVDEDCPGGYACDDDFNECEDSCYEESHCRSGWSCCDDFGAACDYGTCVRD